MGEVSQFEDLLLKSARNGDHKTIIEIIKADNEGKVTLNINCKGQSKYNFGWTPLHLSTYFGHKICVETLLQNGAHVDIQNNSGDTPLHKAALTHREEIVMLLLEHGASVSIINGEGLKPSDMARKSQVKKLIEAAERAEQKGREDKLLHAAREGDADEVKRILQDSCAPNINCVDSMGNTSLHCAAYRGHINVAVILLQNGCDTSVKNYAGQTAHELVQSQQMEQVLAVPPLRSFSRKVTRFEGPLLRKMRIVGWRMVWAVLERGVLTFFNSRADASSGFSRRDYKYLDSAKAIPALVGDQAVFIVQYSDGTRHRLAALSNPVHSASVNRQKWVCALEDHIKFSTHYVQNGFSIESDDDEDEEERSFKPLGCMEDALSTAKAHQELLEQQIQQTMAIICSLQDENEEHEEELRVIENFTALNTVARNMSSSLSHCLALMKQQEEVRELYLKEEKEKVRVLEESLRVLATEHHDLEESLASRLSSSSEGHSLYNTPANSFMSLSRPRRFFPSSTNEEFFDAFSQDDDTCTLKSLPSPSESVCSMNTLVSCMSSLPLDPQSPESQQQTFLDVDEAISPYFTTQSLLDGTGVGGTYTKVTSSSSGSSLPWQGEMGVEGKQEKVGESHLPELSLISSNDTNQETACKKNGSVPAVCVSSASRPSFQNPDGMEATAFQISMNSTLPSTLGQVSTLPFASPTLSSPESQTLSTPMPETPLLRTSDLSEHEDNNSGDSENSNSSQSKKEFASETEDKSFSLVSLGGSRYKGPYAGPRRCWRSWGSYKEKA